MSEEEVVQTENSGTEKEARLFGWVSKDEFRGNEAEWVDAESFVKRGKEINPILRKNNELLMKKFEDKVKEIDSIKASLEDFKSFQKESYERKQTDLQNQIAELKDKKKEAIAEGNGDLVVNIDDQLDDIKEAQRTAKEQAKVATSQQPVSLPNDPELQSWVERNDWFGKDTEMTDVSNGLGASVRRQFPNLSSHEFLLKLDEKIAEYFPDKVSGGRPKGSSVDAGGDVRGGGSTGKKSYASLPADAKLACDKFVKAGLFKSKQDYVDLYSWD